MDNKEFEKILADDEYVIKTYRPNSKRLALGNLFVILWSLIPIAAFATLLIVLSNTVEEFGISEMIPFFLCIGMYFFMWLFIVISLIGTGLKICYAVTNKRLIMRKGFTGERYICLDLSSIQTRDVKSGVLDKWVQPNTGRLIFSSKESFVTAYKNHKSNNNIANNIGLIVFSYIENPFEVFKYINSLIDQAKLEEKQ